MAAIVLAFIVGLIILGILGAWVSAQKNRDGLEGFLLGCLFGPLGVLIAALLPTLPPSAKPISEQEADRLTYPPPSLEAIAIYVAIGIAAFVAILILSNMRND